MKTIQGTVILTFYTFRMLGFDNLLLLRYFKICIYTALETQEILDLSV